MHFAYLTQQTAMLFQVWKCKVMPLLQRHFAEQVDPMTTYMLLQHEAAIANLLEVLLSLQQ